MALERRTNSITSAYELVSRYAVRSGRVRRLCAVAVVDTRARRRIVRIDRMRPI
jgi:hypothetical protein